MKIDKAEIGQKIKKYRKLMHFTQGELAERVNLNEKQISRIEAGLNYPALASFLNILEVLNVEIGEFLEENIQKSGTKEELIMLIKNSNENELKIYLDILKPLSKNLNSISKKALEMSAR